MTVDCCSSRRPGCLCESICDYPVSPSAASENVEEPSVFSTFDPSSLSLSFTSVIMNALRAYDRHRIGTERTNRWKDDVRELFWLTAEAAEARYPATHVLSSQYDEKSGSEIVAASSTLVAGDEQINELDTKPQLVQPEPVLAVSTDEAPEFEDELEPHDPWEHVEDFE